MLAPLVSPYLKAERPGLTSSPAEHVPPFENRTEDNRDQDGSAPGSVRRARVHRTHVVGLPFRSLGIRSGRWRRASMLILVDVSISRTPPRSFATDRSLWIG